MLINYEKTVVATISFLKSINVKVNNQTVNETLQNHPEWPSLLCVSDSLSKWNIPNGAGRVTPEQIDEIPVPFLAYTQNNEFPLAIVTNVTSEKIQLRQKNYNREITVKRDDFIRNWQGVYLIAEPNERSGQPDYEKANKKQLLRMLLPVFSIAIFLIFSTLQLLQYDYGKFTNFQIGLIIQFIISFAGLVVSSMLLWYEIDRNNPVLQKVCTGFAKTNCNAILTSNAAKILGISWSEIGFFYFSGAILSLSFLGLKAVLIVSIFNSLAVLYTPFSIYYQWKIAKQWCVLCLAVQVLLVLQGVNVWSNHLLETYSLIDLTTCVETFLLYVLPVVCWYLVKPYLLKLQDGKYIKQEYSRMKFNSEIFNLLLKKQKQIRIDTNGLGIDLGNSEAENTLVKVCNPYCGPCAEAHPHIEELLHNNPTLKVKIIFTTPNEDGHYAIDITRHLMAISERSNEDLTQQALDNWYNTKEKEYAMFAAKYPMNRKLVEQDEKIEAMATWCKKSEIAFTPTFFLNGHQLPEAYNISDLKYFLLE